MTIPKEEEYRSMQDHDLLVAVAVNLDNVKEDVREIKGTNEKQWEAIGKTSERVANIEGQLEATKNPFWDKKKKGTGLVGIVVAVFVVLQQTGVIG